MLDVFNDQCTEADHQDAELPITLFSSPSCFSFCYAATRFLSGERRSVYARDQRALFQVKAMPGTLWRVSDFGAISIVARVNRIGGWG